MNVWVIIRPDNTVIAVVDSENKANQVKDALTTLEFGWPSEKEAWLLISQHKLNEVCPGEVWIQESQG